MDFKYSQGPNIRTFFCHQFYDKFSSKYLTQNGNGAIDTISEPSAGCGSSEVNGLAETMNDFELDSQPTKKLKQSKLTQFFKNK